MADSDSRKRKNDSDISDDSDEEEPTTTRKRARDEELAFELEFSCLTNFNQMISIVGNVPEIKGTSIAFEIHKKGEEGFEGVMVSHQSMAVIFYGRLSCTVVHLDDDERYHTFTVPIKEFIGIAKNTDPSYVLTITRVKGDDKLNICAKSPDPSGTGMVERYDINETDMTVDISHFRNMRFPFSLQMQTDKLRDTLNKASSLDVRKITFTLTKLSNGDSEATVIAMAGMSDGRTVSMKVYKVLSARVDDNNETVYDYDVLEMPPGLRNKENVKAEKLEEAVYKTSTMLEIIKNMKKQQNVRIAFGSFDTETQDGDQVSIKDPDSKPFLLEMSLGSETAYLRFVLHNVVDDDDE